MTQVFNLAAELEYQLTKKKQKSKHMVTAETKKIDCSM